MRYGPGARNQKPRSKKDKFAAREDLECWCRGAPDLERRRYWREESDTIGVDNHYSFFASTRADTIPCPPASDIRSLD
jgi:hypothetical protein